MLSGSLEELEFMRSFQNLMRPSENIKTIAQNYTRSTFGQNFLFYHILGRNKEKFHTFTLKEKSVHRSFLFRLSLTNDIE
jgi:hypothetical protein